MMQDSNMPIKTEIVRIAKRMKLKILFPGILKDVKRLPRRFSRNKLLKGNSLRKTNLNRMNCCKKARG